MCVPDERKDKFAKELVRPMFFFKCYKVRTRVLFVRIAPSGSDTHIVMTVRSFP